MKSLYAFVFFVPFSLTVSAQSPAPIQTPTPATTDRSASNIVEPLASCDLTVKYSPIVSGLKLDMPEAEAALKLGGQFVKDPTDPLRKSINAGLEKNAIFSGDKIVSGTLRTVNERVTSIQLTYSLPWTSAKDFVNNFAPKLGLVRLGFRLDDEKKTAKTVCKDFSVELKAAGPGSEIVITQIASPLP